MKFWALVGDSNTHKTSTIRALTGVGNRQEAWCLRLSDGSDIVAWIETSSPQERGEPPPDEFARDVARNANSSVTHVILPLGFKARKGIVSAEHYIHHLVDAEKWECLGIVVTGSNRPDGAFRPIAPTFTVRMPTKPFEPANAIANQVREWWRI